MSFKCVVVTPEHQALDETVNQAILPAHDGKIGILTNRAPLLVKLGLGALSLDMPGGQHRVMYIEGGVAQMKDNKLTILTQEAIDPKDIDVESARAEMAEAAARRVTDEKSYNERQRKLDRGRALQELARK